MDSKVVEYLKTLKASEIADFDPPLLRQWNALQKTPTKRRNFTFMEVQKGRELASLLASRYLQDSVVKWAWIFHDKDNTEHTHYHFYIEFPNPRSFTSVANELNIPVTNLQQVFDKKGILEYLTHENAPDKHHYAAEEVHANFDIETEINPPKVDLHKEFEDWRAVREGRMNFHDFLNIYEGTLSDLRIIDRIRLYDRALGYDTK